MQYRLLIFIAMAVIGVNEPYIILILSMYIISYFFQNVISDSDSVEFGSPILDTSHSEHGFGKIFKIIGYTADISPILDLGDLVGAVIDKVGHTLDEVVVEVGHETGVSVIAGGVVDTVFVIAGAVLNEKVDVVSDAIKLFV